MEGIGEVGFVDPTVKAGSAYVRTPQDLALDIADLVPGSGDVVGPGWAPGTSRMAARQADRPGSRRGGGCRAGRARTGWRGGGPRPNRVSRAARLVSRDGRRRARRGRADQRAAEAPVRARQGVRRAVREGSTAGALHRDGASARWPHARTRSRRPRASRCCTTPFSSTTTSRTAATPAEACATMHRRVGVPIAVNTGDAMNALAMRLFRQSGERLGPALRSGSRRGRPHAAREPRGTGDGARLGARQRSLDRHRRLPAARPQEDRLVQLHPPDADRRARRRRQRCRPRSLRPLRLPARARVPDHGRRAQPRGQQRDGTARRSTATSGRGSGPW